MQKLQELSRRKLNQELRNNLTKSCIESTGLLKSFARFTKTCPSKREIYKSKSCTVSEAIRKPIMRRENLQTIFFKKRTPESLKKYKKRWSYCSKL